MTSYSGTTLILISLLFVSIRGQPQPVWTDNCLQVSSSGTCTQCVQGFFLLYFLCMPCASLCQCSNQYNYCESCMTLQYKHTTYDIQPYLKQSQGRCYFCDNWMNNCLACTNPNFCTQCYGGYYVVDVLDPSGKVIGSQCSTSQCQINPLTQQTNCEICISSTQCSQCIQGYFLNKNTKQCATTQCTANCLECTDLTTCSKCMPGYFQTAGFTCAACIAECVTCLDATTCQECAPGYYYDQNECVTTGFSNCVLYTGGASSASACQICQPGYFVLYGSCNQCVGCDLCSLQFICQSKCQTGTVPFNYACITPLSSVAIVFPLLLLALIYLTI